MRACGTSIKVGLDAAETAENAVDAVEAAGMRQIVTRRSSTWEMEYADWRANMESACCRAISPVGGSSMVTRRSSTWDMETDIAMGSTDAPGIPMGRDILPQA